MGRAAGGDAAETEADWVAIGAPHLITRDTVSRHGKRSRTASFTPISATATASFADARRFASHGGTAIPSGRWGTSAVHRRPPESAGR